MTLQEVVARFNTTPFLFAGSGITRPYYGLPDWEGLLREFAGRINPDRFAYNSYKSVVEASGENDGLMPKIASLIQKDFDSKWFSTPEIRTLSESELAWVEKGVSPFKAEVASFLAEKSSVLPEYVAEIGKLKNIKLFPMHIEVRVTKTGDVVPIEINPMRFAGWCTTDVANYAWRINV